MRLQIDTAEKLGVSKRTVEQLVQTAANLTQEAKKIIKEAIPRSPKGTRLKFPDCLQTSRKKPLLV